MNIDLQLELQGVQAEEGSAIKQVSPTETEATPDRVSESGSLEIDAKPASNHIGDKLSSPSLIPEQKLPPVPELCVYLGDKLLARVGLCPDQTLAELRGILSIPAQTDFLIDGDSISTEDECQTTVEEIMNSETNSIHMATRAAEVEKPAVIEALLFDPSPAVDIPKQLAQSVPGKKAHSSAIFLKAEGGFRLFKMPAVTLPKRAAERKRALDRLGEYKTILMVGETGAGKSTLINALINFWLGVKFEDDLRYIIDEQSHPSSQTNSQTSEIKFYFLEGTEGRPNLLLVDTPGYGDTQGIKKDLQIDAMISNLLLNDISSIDMVCFVAKASTVRFTETQQYVYRKILNFFDDSSLANFKYVFTFADGADPQVIKELNKPGSLIEPMIKSNEGRSWFIKVNNSSLLACDSPEKMFVQIYWRLTFGSLETLCQDLNSIPRYCLKQFQERLQQIEKCRSKRMRLESIAQKELTKFYNLHKIYRALGLHRGEFELKPPNEVLVQIQSHILDFHEQYRSQPISIGDDHENLVDENRIQQKLVEGDNRHQAIPREPAFIIDEQDFEWQAIQLMHLEARYVKKEDCKFYDKKYLIRKGLIAEHNDLSNRCLQLLEEVCSNDEAIYKLLPRKNAQPPKKLPAILEDHILHFTENRGRLTESAIQALGSLKTRLQKLPMDEGAGKTRLAQLRIACKQGLLDEPEPKLTIGQQIYKWRRPLITAAASLAACFFGLGIYFAF